MKNHRSTSYFPPLFCTSDFFHDVSLHSTIMYDSKITPKRVCQKQWARTYLKPVCPLHSKLTAFLDHQTRLNLDVENKFDLTRCHFASNLLHCIKLQTGRVKQNKNPLRDLQLFKGFRVCFFFCRIFYFHANPCLAGFQPRTFSNGGVVAVAVSFLYNMLEGNNRVLSTWCGASLDRL